MKLSWKLMGIMALGLGALALPGTAKADNLTVVYSTGGNTAYSRPIVHHAPAYHAPVYHAAGYHPVVYHRPVVVQRVAYGPRHWHKPRHGNHYGWDRGRGNPHHNGHRR